MADFVGAAIQVLKWTTLAALLVALFATAAAVASTMATFAHGLVGARIDGYHVIVGNAFRILDDPSLNAPKVFTALQAFTVAMVALAVSMGSFRLAKMFIGAGGD